MKSFKSLITRMAAGALLTVAVVAGVSGASVSAAQIPYVPGQPLNSPTNPAFNIYTNIPYGVGNEADFVRLRPSTGTVNDNGPNGERNQLYVDTLNDDCKIGDIYDVRTYVHNGAAETGNQNGTGPAIAHNTTVAMSAPLNQTNKNFTFSSTISASNAASVTDTGKLNCSGANARLQLVPQSVKVYSKALGWQSINDSAVNGSTKIGTHAIGSGDVWGCWDERVLVAYVVKVVEVPQEPVYTCDLLTVTKLADRKYKFDVKYTARNGATFKEVRFDYGDGQTGTSTEHTFEKDGTYNVVATVAFMVNGQERTATGDACAKQVTVTPKNCPVPGKEHLPEGHPECKYCPTNPELPADDPRCNETPTVLPETGAAGLAGMFAAVSAAGAGAHQFVTRRRRG